VGEHITPLDATFLELEESDESAHMHIGAVMVFDPLPESGGPPSLERLQAHLLERLGMLPRYRQRLSVPRTGRRLSWPTWEEDGAFDIAAHVRHATLPGPGGDAELLDWASDYFSHRVDRARPLWDAVLIDGLDGDRWALATKTHHAMVDGVGSVDVGHLLLDAAPGGAPQAPPAEPAAGDARGSRAPAAAAGGRSLAHTLADGALLPLRAGSTLAHGARAGADLALHPRRLLELLERAEALAEVIVRDELIAAPPSSLNVPIGGTRRLAVVRVPLAELKAAKDELGATVNDVVLAATSGGLHRLLVERGDELSPHGLRAMVPMNIRQASERLALGNRITSLFVNLPVDEADPRRRLERVQAEVGTLKAGSQALGSKTLIDLAALAPPALHAFIARSLFATRLFNVTVTNVPGPQSTLYAFGAPLREIWPLVPIAAEHALGIAVISYDGGVVFCLNCDRGSMSDADVLAAGIETSLAELRVLPGKAGSAGG